MFQLFEEARRKADDGSGGFGMNDMEEELRVLEDKLDADDDDELFCVACNKEMRNEKAFASHRKQRKHLDNVEKLREALLEDDLVNSEELVSSDSAEELQELDSTSKDQQISNDEIGKDEKPKQLASAEIKQNKKTRRNKNANKKNGNTSENDKAYKVDSLNCAVCKQEFPSKNKLFGHLKDTGHAVALR